MKQSAIMYSMTDEYKTNITELREQIELLLSENLFQADTLADHFISNLLNFLNETCIYICADHKHKTEPQLSQLTNLNLLIDQLKANTYLKNSKLSTIIYSAIHYGLLDNHPFRKELIIKLFNIKATKPILKKSNTEEKTTLPEKKSKKQVRFPKDEEIAEFRQIGVQIGINGEKKEIINPIPALPVTPGGRHIFLIDTPSEQITKENKYRNAYIFCKNPLSLYYINPRGKSKLLAIPPEEQSIISNINVDDPAKPAHRQLSATALQILIDVIKSNPDPLPGHRTQKRIKAAEKPLADRLNRIINHGIAKKKAGSYTKSYLERQKLTALNAELAKETKLNLNIQDKRGSLPLIEAIKGKYPQIANLFLTHHADPDQKDANGSIPLFVAFAKYQYSIMDQLLEKKADLYQVDSQGRNLLMLGSYLRQAIPFHEENSVKKANQLAHIKKYINKLLAFPFDHQQTDHQDNTLLIYAAANGQIATVRHIIAQSPLNHRNQFGETALMLAAQSGHYKVVQALLNAGANPSLQNNEGQTALDLAVIGNHKKVIKQLSTFYSRNIWKLFGLTILTGMSISLAVTGILLPFGLTIMALTYLTIGLTGASAIGIMAYNEYQLKNEPAEIKADKKAGDQEQQPVSAKNDHPALPKTGNDQPIQPSAEVTSLLANLDQAQQSLSKTDQRIHSLQTRMASSSSSSQTRGVNSAKKPIETIDLVTNDSLLTFT